MKGTVFSLAAMLVSACGIYINTYNSYSSYSTSSLAVASEWVGYHQRTNRIELTEFLGVDPVRIEWCAAFVNSVLAAANIPGSDSVHRNPLLARSFLLWGTAVDVGDITSGDVVIFPRGWAGWQGHVGFYVETVEVNGVEYWAILGGNQNNSVSIDLYLPSRALDIRRWVVSAET